MDAHIDLRAGGFRALSVTALRRIGRVENGMDWLRGVALNHRPLGYEPNELPDCSTPHFDHKQCVRHRQTFAATTSGPRGGLYPYSAPLGPMHECQGGPAFGFSLPPGRLLHPTLGSKHRTDAGFPYA